MQKDELLRRRTSRHFHTGNGETGAERHNSDLWCGALMDIPEMHDRNNAISIAVSTIASLNPPLGNADRHACLNPSLLKDLP